jgi:hypothetical protein
MRLNRIEELIEEAADCDRAAKDCLEQRLYADAARFERRADEIRQLLAVSGAAQAAIMKKVQGETWMLK